MKQEELIPIIKNFGFVNISKKTTKSYYSKYPEEPVKPDVINKFKFKQCYITFEGIDIYISFNNPNYTFKTTDISIKEVQSLLYYLSIISNRKFTLKKENPDICNLYMYFEEKSKYFPTMTYRDRRRYEQDFMEFNTIKEKYFSGIIE